MSISGTINSTTESVAYTYDDLGRLITSNQTSNSSSAQRRFVYDRWGNRTGMWDAPSGGTQLQSIALQQSGGVPTNRIASVTASGVTKNYSYDANGNVTDDGIHTYSYDAENRLKEVDDGATAAFAYDYRNRRIKKVVTGASTHYVWESNQVIAEHDAGTGAVIYNYVYAESRLLARMGSGVINWYVNDRLSQRLVLDSSGNVIGRMAHLPFGEDFAESDSQEKHHFANYERDSESALDYAVNRSNSPNLGRFLQADPYKASGYMVDPQSWNRYAYVGGDPINAYDPIGLLQFPIISIPLFLPSYVVDINGGGGMVNAHGSGPSGGDFYGQFLNGNESDESKADPEESENDKILNRVLKNYDKCRQKIFGDAVIYNNKALPPSISSVWALQATGGRSEVAALVLAIWAKESNFAFLNATDDHGPMQLTDWVRRHYPRFIIPGAYDNFTRPAGSPRRLLPFGGDPAANVFTAARYLTYLYDSKNGDISAIAAEYHGVAATRKEYGKEVASQWYAKYKEFTDCLMAP